MKITPEPQTEEAILISDLLDSDVIPALRETHISITCPHFHGEWQGADVCRKLGGIANRNLRPNGCRFLFFHESIETSISVCYGNGMSLLRYHFHNIRIHWAKAHDRQGAKRTGGTSLRRRDDGQGAKRTGGTSLRKN